MTSCNNLQQKQFEVNVVVSEVLITHVTNRGKARMMSSVRQRVINASDTTKFALNAFLLQVIAIYVISEQI